MPKAPPEQAPLQPHDALFKFVFSQREHAAGLLRAALPEVLARALDDRTLRIEPATFVDRALRSRYSDLVVSARLRGQRTYFYVLVEHQRDVEHLMVLRMGIYMMRLWEHLLRERPSRQKVPPIVPLLIHHSAKGWTAPTAFQEIIAMEGAVRRALKPYTPGFELRLIDLGKPEASPLVEKALTALSQIAFALMQAAGDDARLEAAVIRMGAALDEVVQAKDGRAALEALMRYIVSTHPRLSVETLGKLLERAAGPKTTEAFVSWIDDIELRGERKGERRGERTGRVKSLLQQLAARFGELPANVVARVEAAKEATIERWTVRVLTAPTLKDVLDGGGKDTARRRPSTRRRATTP